MSKDFIYIDPKDIELLPYDKVPPPPGAMSTGRIQAGVRLRHIPTGIEVAIADYRSQHRNRQAALEILAKLLAERESS